MAKGTIKWKRPQDVVTFRTSDPKKMLNKYLPHNVLKKWNEDFTDSSTGEIVSIERSQVITSSGRITQDKLQEIMFAIQSGDIEDVEVCNEDIQDMILYMPKYQTAYMVEIPIMSAGGVVKNHFVTYAQTIPQAIVITAEFGQMHRGFHDWVKAKKVVPVDAIIIPDDHACIPEEDRTPAYERKEYFKVQVRSEWMEEDELRKCDEYYIIAAEEVGQAKERVALYLDILKAEREAKGDRGPKVTTTIRKAVPFEVDCIVPKEFSELYYEEPTKINA